MSLARSGRWVQRGLVLGLLLLMVNSLMAPVTVSLAAGVVPCHTAAGGCRRGHLAGVDRPARVRGCHPWRGGGGSVRRGLQRVRGSHGSGRARARLRHGQRLDRDAKANVDLAGRPFARSSADRQRWRHLRRRGRRPVQQRWVFDERRLARAADGQRWGCRRRAVLGHGHQHIRGGQSRQRSAHGQQPRAQARRTLGNSTDTNDNSSDTRLEPAPVAQNLSSPPVPSVTPTASPTPRQPSRPPRQPSRPIPRAGGNAHAGGTPTVAPTDTPTITPEPSATATSTAEPTPFRVLSPRQRLHPRRFRRQYLPQNQLRPQLVNRTSRRPDANSGAADRRRGARAAARHCCDSGRAPNDANRFDRVGPRRVRPGWYGRHRAVPEHA